jgi:hypothetical protein
MKKRYIFILVVIVLAIIILAAINYYLGQKKATDQQGEISNETQTNADFPIPPGVDMAEFSANSQAELSEQINSYIDSQVDSKLPSGKENGLKDVRFKDSIGRSVTLNNFQQAVGINIDKQLEPFLKQDDYNFIVCSGKKGENNYGLILNIRLLAKDEEHPDVKKTLASWEPSMLLSLNKILFRDVSINESDLSKKISFKSGKYRYAEINLENGKRININYVWVDDYIVFATSLECTDEIYNYVYGAD